MSFEASIIQFMDVQFVDSDDNNGVGNQPEPPEVPEPHVHGVQINPQTGTAYVSDEGEEECFFESVTILNP